MAVHRCAGAGVVRRGGGAAAARVRAQRRVFAWESGADVACELGARVDGVRRQRVGVFVSAGAAVGGAGGVGVSVLILSVFSSSCVRWVCSIVLHCS